MDLKLKQRIGTMSVVTNEELETMEFLSVDRIGIMSQDINVVVGFAHFHLAFGGMDSLGRFHLDPKKAAEVAPIVIQRQRQPKEFDELFCDPSGTVRTAYPDGFVEMLMESIVLPTAHKLIWGAIYPGMEVELDGRCIFSGIASRKAEIQAAEVELTKAKESDPTNKTKHIEESWPTPPPSEAEPESTTQSA